MGAFGDLLNDTLEKRFITIKGNERKRRGEQSKENGVNDVGQFITKKVDAMEKDSGIEESFVKKYRNKIILNPKFKYLKMDEKGKEFIVNDKNQYETNYLNFVTAFLQTLSENFPKDYLTKDKMKDDKKQIYLWLKKEHNKLYKLLTQTGQEDHNQIKIEEP